MANGASRGIEIGLIGREGMTGLALLMGMDRTPHDVFMQNAGRGWRIPAAELRRALVQRRSLLGAMLQYAHVFNIQTSYTAVANGRNKIEERLARWLLMAHDRLDSDRLTITHEFLSQMLSVRRPGVTVALKALEKTGAIEVGRNGIGIVNRKALQKLSNGSYGVPEAELLRAYGAR